MASLPFPDQPPPPLTTNVMDRINFAIQFEKYRDIALKRWWLFGICVVIPMIYRGYTSYKEPDVYMATGRMMVSPQIRSPVGDAYVEEAANFYGTQVRLMQSSVVTGPAAEKLVDFAKKFGITSSPGLNVIQERNTAIFHFSVTSTSHEYARLFLNQVMEEYIVYKKKIREQTSESAAVILLREVDRLNKERQKAEADLLDFQKQNNMIYIEGQGSLASQYMLDLKRRLAEVRTEIDLLDTETNEQTLNRAPITPLVEGVKPAPREKDEPQKGEERELIPSPKNLRLPSDGASIKNEITLLRAERDDLLKNLQSKHPKIIRIDEEIQRKERLLKVIREQNKEQIALYRESLIKQKEALEKSLVDWEKQAFEANQKASEFAFLKSNLSPIKELYDILLKRVQEIGISTTVGQELIQINEPAKASSTAIAPNRTRNVMVTGGLGLLLTIAIIFLLERFDDRVKNLDELQDMLQETVLGQVPMIPGGEDSSLLMVNLPPQNIFSESFRNIRSSLMFSPTGGQARTIVVTSAIPNDGKTTCAVNLAICLAQVEGGRTLLIDADMRKMNIHNYFKMENGIGLSEILSGQANLTECVVPTSVSNLDLLRAGTTPPNPGELIMSENFKHLLEDSDRMYQRIVIDTPPALATDDTLSIAPVVDGTIFIVKANQTSIRFVNRSMTLLKQRGAKIFGVVLNHIDTTSAHYYYYYYYTGYYNYAAGRNTTKRQQGAIQNFSQKPA